MPFTSLHPSLHSALQVRNCRTPATVRNPRLQWRQGISGSVGKGMAKAQAAQRKASTGTAFHFYLVSEKL